MPFLPRRPLMAALALNLLGAREAASAAYPDRPVTLVVPFAPGGSTDIAGRIIAERMAATLGQRLVVENRAGAGGAVASLHVRNAAPDAYTLLLASASSHGVNPAVFADLGYDPVADFAPVSVIGATPIALVVPPGSPARDLAGLVALLRTNPDRASYGSAGAGSITHLAGAWFASLADAPSTHIPYRGGGPALEAAIKNEVAFLFETTATLAGAIADGRVRPIAIATSARVPAFAAVPTFAEAGLDGFEIGSWNAILAPRGAAPDRIDTLARAARVALADESVAGRLTAMGVVPGGVLSPRATGAFIRSEVEKFRAIAARTGIVMERG